MVYQFWRWSPIQVLTGLGVDKLCWCEQRHYQLSQTATFNSHSNAIIEIQDFFHTDFMTYSICQIQHIGNFSRKIWYMYIKCNISIKQIFTKINKCNILKNSDSTTWFFGEKLSKFRTFSAPMSKFKIQDFSEQWEPCDSDKWYLINDLKWSKSFTSWMGFSIASQQ